MSQRERLRRTMMFLPGNNPAMITDAHIYGADSIMIDLEDAVSVNQKDAARLLVYHALKRIDYGTTEVVVRINGLNTPFGKDDVIAMVKAGVDVIRLPKTDTPEEIHEVDALITAVEKEIGAEGRTMMMAAIESATGIINAVQIAQASPRLMGIALGAEDYVTNLKTTRSSHAMEIFYAREQILHAARNAGLYALDTAFADINNIEAFRNEVQFIKDLGFDGKSVVHPKQIRVVHDIYTPSEKEITKALRVIAGAAEAERKGSGVIAVDGKMVDGPIITRAHRVIELAKASGVYKEV
ncbi:citrate (pro-3S)-lyase subunit beta [Treponema phagedenis]|uniref:Citrate lyase subunit beta n=1 Tax=Treponema phagedenis TaxID=162 RepID=A0A0B7GXI8_TREPH|nr:citrate (pro-3S)-lyase subunit beta [Treponema phagedenis]NVP22879.1 citrate (pro-3S)-lyase subunit beta [Treponema phagedenis]QEJ94953.1 citrate (pro-3S)-lyase subunit beta [Treponema phagedenis]QEJ98318.1 citrate (pro-3S)-lyase subunit beta [Treponema phagedenis]QEK00856.1 citrate (pro-3S)-lyase subunit beta [Treponema phagedenis]QEK03828.1 citrate (pro-3S)-lyase subunit beta [Treponema phagedenis]